MNYLQPRISFPLSSCVTFLLLKGRNVVHEIGNNEAFMLCAERDQEVIVERVSPTSSTFVQSIVMKEQINCMSNWIGSNILIGLGDGNLSFFNVNSNENYSLQIFSNKSNMKGMIDFFNEIILLYYIIFIYF